MQTQHVNAVKVVVANRAALSIYAAVEPFEGFGIEITSGYAREIVTLRNQLLYSTKRTSFVPLALIRQVLRHQAQLQALCPHGRVRS